MKCGGQSLSCSCQTEEKDIWTGIMYEEAMKFCEDNDLFVTFSPTGGYAKADKNDLNSYHDLNTAVLTLMQNKKLERGRHSNGRQK